MDTAIPQFRARGHRQHQPAGGLVPIAFVGRTSTETLQDPVESLSRQIRLARERLPEGFAITGWYWDVESGGIDLDARSRDDVWEKFAAAGIPRTGGMADLRAALSGRPPFSAVICENIGRSGRDMYDALRLEKELRAAGMMIFATNEPIDAQAPESSTILVRRMHQAEAEYFRYNLKTQMWEGLRQYALSGFNTGPTPYGYLADRTPHPNPMKASMGATRARLVPDPERGPWVTRMFEWRVYEKLSVPGIARRLTERGAPSPNGGPWSPDTVTRMLANPKYTGRIVLGRTTNTGPTRRKGERRDRTLPREYWTWATQENAHPALISLDMWEAAQHTGAERGNVRDHQTPPKRDTRFYPYRARLWCRQCSRRMHGSTAPGRHPGEEYTYYVCPTRAGNPRHAHDHPSHIRAAIAAGNLTSALSQFLDDYALGYDRAATLAQLIPATAADRHDQDQQHAATLRRKLTKTETAINALITQLERLGASTRPADIALCDRIRHQFAHRHDEHTAITAELQAIDNTAPAEGNDLSLIDELPYAPGLLAHAPDHIRQHIAAAFDMHAIYRADTRQATITLTITDATPALINALITDPRTDHDTDTAGPPATSGDIPDGAIAPQNAHKSRAG